jgi:beta-mannosidase
MLDLNLRTPSELVAQFEVVQRDSDQAPQTYEFSRNVEASGPQVFAFQVANPQPWNSWDRGEPTLYTLRIGVSDGAGLSDSLGLQFGLRTVELTPNPGAPFDAAPWTFTLNGEPSFIRGANWVPADAIPARVRRQEYADLIGMARDANINLLRVWGGGLKEKQAFYDLCDEQGIMLWQEFPFAGAGADYFPRDRGYLQLVRQESEAIVRSLRNHPAVVLWCGGNEFIPGANRHVTSIVRDVVANLDGTRPFKPASPSSDESHNWRVWHGRANTRDYQQDGALFFSEFGLQSAPAVETLERFLPADQLYPPNEGWEYHNAEIDKLARYAAPLLASRAGRAIDLDSLVAASQEAQLRGLQIAIEHARRNKPRVSGCAFWQFNEPWYSICWSVIDYTRRPKRALEKIKELYNPVLVSFAYPLRQRATGEIVSGQLWLVNDSNREYEGSLNGWHNDIPVVTRDLVIPPNSTGSFESLDLQLAPGANVLRLEYRAAEMLSTNEYDLNYCDTGEITRQQALLAKLAAWLRTRT